MVRVIFREFVNLWIDFLLLIVVIFIVLCVFEFKNLNRRLRVIYEKKKNRDEI